MSGRHRKPHSRATGRHRRPPGPARYIAPGLVVVALLGAGGVGAHAALTNSTNAPAPQPAATTQPLPVGTPSTSPSTSPSPRPTATASASASAPAPSAMRQRPTPALQLVVTGSVSWIEVRRPNGHVLVSGMVRHGHRLTYRHGPLAVVIGNAGAVRVARNGHTHVAGRPGEVVHLTVD